MDLIKINGTIIELRTDYGSLIRIIARDGLYAEINPFDDNMIMITRVNGMVDLLDKFGAISRNITNEATLARFNGDELAISKRNGMIEIRNIMGALLRVV